MRVIAFVLCFMVVPAWAQQQPTPAQTALQIDNVINQWAQTIEALQAQLANSQARVKELEDKYEPKADKSVKPK